MGLKTYKSWYERERRAWVTHVYKTGRNFLAETYCLFVFFTHKHYEAEITARSSLTSPSYPVLAESSLKEL